MKTKTDSGETVTTLSGLRWLAILSAVIAMTGILYLMSENSRAEDIPPPPPPGPPGMGPNSGFNRGRNMGNPFSNVNNNPTELFDEEEDENISPIVSGGKTGGGDSGDVPNPRRTSHGVEVGGGAPSGVVSHTKATSLSVDTETGRGSNEVVTDFNFPDAEIMDIAKTLAKLTGKNFIYDKEVKGRVSILSNSPITVGDAWKAFLTALDINGFALIPSGRYIRIARQRDARDKQLKTYTGEESPDTDSLITRVFALKYISAEEVARTFRSFMPANSRIIPYEQTNTVIVTDTGSNISKLAKMLEFLDVEGYDAGIEVVTVKHASAAELAKIIDTLIPGTGQKGGVGGPPRPFGGASFTARRTKEGGIINTIIADERTNTLIIHANTKGADQVRELVAKLDKKMPASAGGGRIHVMYLQFADAEQVANTLNGLGQTPSGGGAPSGGPGGGGVGVNPMSRNIFEGQIKVSPDKATNSLVITASANDFVTLQRVINRIDIPRDEVYSEVVIMEMSLGKNFTFSSNVVLPTSGIGFLPNTDLAQFFAAPFTQKGVLLGFKQGKTTNVDIGGKTVGVSSVQGLIKALQTTGLTNVLATPQILTLDNTEATFESGEKIPVPTTNVAAGGTVTAGISREDVSLSITLKPQINKISNFVKLDVKTKLAELSSREPPADLQGKSFIISNRTVNTNIVVANEDTVVIGGLIRDKQQEIISKVPILGDIPLLGWLFRSKDSQIDKTNLLIFITPHIIKSYEKVRAILDKKLKQRDEFLERSVGGEDPHREYRDEMIRGLPNIKDITDYKPKKSATLNEEDENTFSAPLSPGASGGGGSYSEPATSAPSALPSTPPTDPSGMMPDMGNPMPPPPPPPFEGGE